MGELIQRNETKTHTAYVYEFAGEMCVDIPQEYLDELRWDETTELSMSIKMGVNSNVIVIERVNKA